MSSLINELLQVHYATTKPGIVMPTVDKEYQDRVKKKQEDVKIVPTNDWGA